MQIIFISKWIITGVLSDGNTISIPAASCKFEYENEKLKTREFTEIKEELKNSESGTVKQNVCISYYDSNICKYLSCTGEVSVTKPIVKDVRITKFPKTQYIKGESFNPYGMIVTAYTSDDGSDSYEYKDNSPYFSYSNDPLNTGEIPFDIKFRLYGEDYTFQLIIKVTENKIASLVIEPKKKDGPTYIRLGENYTKNDYLSIYDVKKKYINGEVSEQPITGQDVDYLQIFTQKLDYSNSDSVYGKLSAVYNDISSQITVNGEYKETSSNPLLLLPSLPVTVSMDNSVPYNTEAFTDSILASTTSYKIKFADGTVGVITGDKFNNGEKQYEYNGFIYTLKTTKTQVKVKYEANLADSIEGTDIPTAEFVLVDFALYDINIIKDIKILPKPEYEDKLKFRKGELKETQYGDNPYSKYFYGKKIYYTGFEEDISENITYKYNAETAPGVITGAITVDGKEIINEIEITVLNPLRVILKPENTGSAYSTSTFTFTDELGNQYDKQVYHDPNYSNKEYSSFDKPNQKLWTNITVKENYQAYFKNHGSIPDIEGTYGEYTNFMGEDFIVDLGINNSSFVYQQKKNSTILNDFNWMKNQNIGFIWFYMDRDRIDTEEEFGLGSFAFVNENGIPINIEYDSVDSIKVFTEEPEIIYLKVTLTDTGKSYKKAIKLFPAETKSVKYTTAEKENVKIIYENEENDKNDEDNFVIIKSVSDLLKCPYIEINNNDLLFYYYNGEKIFQRYLRGNYD